MKTITIDGIEYQLIPVTTKWKPQEILGKEYHYITVVGELGSTRYTMNPLDKKCILFGNYFHTEEEAQEAATQVRQLLRLRAYVREFASDYKPDWVNHNEQKWFIYYDTRDQEWGVSNNQFMCNITTVYMSEEVAEDLARKLNSGEVVL